MKIYIISFVGFFAMLNLFQASAAPCTTFENLANRDEIETAYVLYRDAFKAGKYDEAFRLWEKAFEAAPAANGKVSYQFDDGIYMYHLKYDKASETEKEAIYQKIMKLYDSKSSCFGYALENNTRKAFDSYYYFSAYSDRDEIFNLFKNCIDAEKLNTPSYVLNPFAELLVEKYFEHKSISTAETQVLVATIKDIIDHAALADEQETDWAEISEYVTDQLGLFEQVKGFYNCAYYKNKYLQDMDSEKLACALMDSIHELVLWAECSESDEWVKTFEMARIKQCKPMIYPDVQTKNVNTCAKEAYEAFERKEYLRAIDKYACAFEEQDDLDKKAAYALVISKMYFGLDKPNYAKSRMWAEQAASYKPNWGAPYILIGKLYASSGKACSEGDVFKSQIVTWPAIDMFIKAKKEDPNVSEEANRLIVFYSKYMPSYDEVFSRELPLGATYKVGCWINRNTTVRKAP